MTEGTRWWVALATVGAVLGACGGPAGDGAVDVRDAELDGTVLDMADRDVTDGSPWPDAEPAAEAVDAASMNSEATAPIFGRAACLIDPGCERLMVAAHRGHHRHLPENSIAGLRSAARLGVDFVEIDVRHTADRALVLMHDGDVDRTTDGTGSVDTLTLAAIQALTLDGADSTKPEEARVPTFEQAIEAAREEGILLYVDQKTSLTADVIAAIATRDAWDLALVRDDLIVVADMAKDEPRLRVMPAIDGQAGFELAESLIAPLYIVEIGGGVDDPELVAAIRAAGVKVQQDMLGPADILGSVGNYVGWKRAVDAGVTLPQTDFPELLVRAAATFNGTGAFPATGPGAAWCLATADCDDANPCTDDTCDPITGACHHADIDCDDGDPETYDFCIPRGADTPHCLNDGMCEDDGDPCTLPAPDSCTPLPKECDDGDPCTTDACDPITGDCVNTPDGC